MTLTIYCERHISYFNVEFWGISTQNLCIFSQNLSPKCRCVPDPSVGFFLKCAVSCFHCIIQNRMRQVTRQELCIYSNLECTWSCTSFLFIFFVGHGCGLALDHKSAGYRLCPPAAVCWVISGQELPGRTHMIWFSKCERLLFPLIVPGIIFLFVY